MGWLKANRNLKSVPQFAALQQKVYKMMYIKFIIIMDNIYVFRFNSFRKKTIPIMQHLINKMIIYSLKIISSNKIIVLFHCQHIWKGMKWKQLR